MSALEFPPDSSLATPVARSAVDAPQDAPVDATVAVPPPGVPAVPRGPRPKRALGFTLAVIGMAVAPLGLGLWDPPFVPAVPALDWTLALDRRSAAAAEAVHGPKVVFVGGSNVRFGIDAAGLSHDLGLPVINYGLNAGLGADVIADRALAIVKPGDVLVFAPELSHFRRLTPADLTDEVRVEFLSALPRQSPAVANGRMPTFPLLQWHRARNRCNRLRGWVENGLMSAFDWATDDSWRKAADDYAKSSPYSVAAVGPDGAIVVPRPTAQPLDHWAYSRPPADLWAMSMSPTGSLGGAAFERVRQACARRGVTLYVMPPLRLAVDHFDQHTLGAEERAWLEYAADHGVASLLPAGSTVFPVADGYDTDYHLNDAGVAVVRTRLAAALRPIVASRVSGRAGGGEMVALPR